MDDTDGSEEYGPVEEEIEHEDEAAVQMEDLGGNVPPVEPPVEYPADELEIDHGDGALEWDSPDLPEVEHPLPTDDFSDLPPDSAKTLAAEEFAAMRESEEAEAISFEDDPAPEEPYVDTVEAVGPFSSGGETAEPFEVVDSELESSKTTPIDVGAVMADPQHETEEESEFELEDEPGEDSMDDADTQDFGDTPPIDEEAPEIELSDEDIDRIARRVMELYTDRIENIAWDVIPDMAEVVVRERVREIEAEAERESS
jgi:hypothetical protein